MKGNTRLMVTGGAGFLGTRVVNEFAAAGWHHLAHGQFRVERLRDGEYRGDEFLERGARLEVGSIGTLEQILYGPSNVADGSMNLIGALRRAMATAGYSDLKEFQRVQVVVAPH